MPKLINSKWSQIQVKTETKIQIVTDIGYWYWPLFLKFVDHFDLPYLQSASYIIIYFWEKWLALLKSIGYSNAQMQTHSFSFNWINVPCLLTHKLKYFNSNINLPFTKDKFIGVLKVRLESDTKLHKVNFSSYILV